MNREQTKGKIVAEFMYRLIRWRNGCEGAEEAFQEAADSLRLFNAHVYEDYMAFVRDHTH